MIYIGQSETTMTCIKTRLKDYSANFCFKEEFSSIKALNCKLKNVESSGAQSVDYFEHNQMSDN